MLLRFQGYVKYVCLLCARDYTRSTFVLSQKQEDFPKPSLKKKRELLDGRCTVALGHREEFAQQNSSTAKNGAWHWQEQGTNTPHASSCLTKDLPWFLRARCHLAFLKGDGGTVTHRLSMDRTEAQFSMQVCINTRKWTQLNGNDQREPGDNPKYLQVYQQAYCLTLGEKKKSQF